MFIGIRVTDLQVLEQFLDSSLLFYLNRALIEIMNCSLTVFYSLLTCRDQETYGLQADKQEVLISSGQRKGQEDSHKSFNFSCFLTVYILERLPLIFTAVPFLS